MASQSLWGRRAPTGIFRKPRHREKGQALCFSHRTMGLHLQLLGTVGQPLAHSTEVLQEPGIYMLWDAEWPRAGGRLVLDPGPRREHSTMLF